MLLTSVTYVPHLAAAGAGVHLVSLSLSCSSRLCYTKSSGWMFCAAGTL